MLAFVGFEEFADVHLLGLGPKPYMVFNFVTDHGRGFFRGKGGGIAAFRIDGEKPFTIDGIEFIPIRVFHYKMPVLGFRIGGFTYITDANDIPEKEKLKIKNSEVLVLNALRREQHVSHFTLEQAVNLMNELKPGKGYFTHISHQLGLHDAVEKELPEFVRLAYDGMKIEV